MSARVFAAAAMLASCAQPLDSQSAVARLPITSRQEMLAMAKRLPEHVWICHAANLTAPCIRNYDTDWKSEQRITGLSYNWGGIDSPEEFDSKIAKGYAAGSHSRHGVSRCTTGIDCSGFVSYCWGLRTHKYTTSNIREIAGKPKYKGSAI